jgi:hypothetical protein
MLIDLNARRSAEAAKNRESRVVRVDEREFELKQEIPLATMHYLSEGDLVNAAKMLLVNADADFEDFIKLVTLDDLGYIVQQWGVTVGESSGSTESFPDTGEPSSPTSADSMAPTSATAATESLPGQ